MTLLIDGHNIIGSCYHGQQGHEGEFSLHKAIRLTIQAVRYTRPESIIVCWDGPMAKRKMRQIYPAYKEGRKGSIFQSDAGRVAIKHYRNIMSALGALGTCVHHLEADHMISLFCQHIDGQKVILSSDQDYYQLVGKDGVRWAKIQDNVCLYDGDGIKHAGTKPDLFHIRRMVFGDASDNIKPIIPYMKKAVLDYVLTLKPKNWDELCKLLTEHCQRGDANISLVKLALDRNRAVSDLRLFSKNPANRRFTRPYMKAAPTHDPVSLRKYLVANQLLHLKAPLLQVAAFFAELGAPKWRAQ